MKAGGAGEGKMGESVRVRVGQLSTRVWAVTVHGRERWRYQLPGMKGPRTLATCKQAKDLARAGLREAEVGRLSLDGLGAAMRRELEGILEVARGVQDLRAAREWLASRARSCAAGEAVERFLEEKRGQVGKPYWRAMASDLRAWAVAAGEVTMADVAAEALREWMEERVGATGPKRRRDVRGYLVGLFRWARKQGLVAPGEVTEADKLAGIVVPVTAVRVLTVEECRVVLRAVGEEWVAYVAAALFLGIRPEELAPASGRVKERLGWECFDWDFGCVRVPAAVAKGGRRPRIVPLNEAARAWLFPRRGTGPLCVRSPQKHGELQRLGALLGGWPSDCLRHTYATARNALLRNLPTLAEEMGNSVAMLHAHYHNPAPREFGEGVFGLLPDTIGYGEMEIQSARSMTSSA